MACKKDDVTVVIPTLNEKEGISDVIEELKECGYHKILVVDGYSTDGTPELALKNGAEVVTQHGIGKTAAIQTALENIDTEYMLVMDGDCTYDPHDIEKFLSHGEKYDEVIGVRVNGRKNISRFNRFGNWLITKTFNLFMSASLSDVCSGMYLLRTAAAKEVDFNTKGFDVEVEVASHIASNGSITEVPVNYRERKGKQKLSSMRHGPKIISSVMNLARANSPVFIFTIIVMLAYISAMALFLWSFWDYFQNGIVDEYYFLMGVFFALLAVQAFMISTVTLQLKRMERRIMRKITGKE
jgi:glycosyltransferase involved in cell wall biosynthesis